MVPLENLRMELVTRSKTFEGWNSQSQPLTSGKGRLWEEAYRLSSKNSGTTRFDELSRLVNILNPGG